MPQSCFLTSPSHHARPYTLTNNRNIKKACSNPLIRMLSECILENMYLPARASQDRYLEKNQYEVCIGFSYLGHQLFNCVREER